MISFMNGATIDIFVYFCVLMTLDGQLVRWYEIASTKRISTPKNFEMDLQLVFNNTLRDIHEITAQPNGEWTKNGFRIHVILFAIYIALQYE